MVIPTADSIQSSISVKIAVGGEQNIQTQCADHTKAGWTAPSMVLLVRSSTQKANAVSVEKKDELEPLGHLVLHE